MKLQPVFKKQVFSVQFNSVLFSDFWSTLLANKMMGTGSSPDLVAVWEVHLPDGIHIVEFEHGTTTGKRILRKVERTEDANSSW